MKKIAADKNYKEYITLEDGSKLYPSPSPEPIHDNSFPRGDGLISMKGPTDIGISDSGGDFIKKVMTSSHPDLAEARDNLMNAIGTVLIKEGFIGLGGHDRLKSMWAGMKDEQIRSVEYSALYTYLYQVFGKK